MASKIWRKDGYTVRWSPVDPRVGYGDTCQWWDGEKVQVRYSIADGDNVVFQGDDLYMGIGQRWDSTTTVGTLGAFFARSEQDCDQEWWDALTPEQKVWCNSYRAEYFRYIASETEEIAIARSRK